MGRGRAGAIGIAAALIFCACSGSRLDLAARWPTKPDPHLTPGATLTVSLKKLCTAGYTATVRNVPTAEAKAVFAAYGVPYAQKGYGELDHLISLELGGSNDASNLWPEFGPRPNAKDAEEGRLHRAVCSGAMPLAEAQAAIVEWPTTHPGK